MTSAPGFNIVGHLSSATGLGTVTRAIAKALTDRGFDVVGLDVDYGGEVDRRLETHDMRLVSRVEDLPYRFNIVCVALQRLPSILLRRLPGLLDARFRNAGLLFWELSVVPKAWIPALRLFDALIACSTFNQASFKTASGIPTMLVDVPLPLPSVVPSRQQARTAFELPQDARVFGCAFDASGDVTRKNALGTLHAFEAAFQRDRRTVLAMKCNGSIELIERNPVTRACLAAAKANASIKIIAGTLSYPETMTLYRAFDVYVSLHRAEGLGLGSMEAMALGLPVIATGYSGNTTFMNGANSVLVPYRLVRPADCNWMYRANFAGRGALWAEPDHDSAVAAMRTLNDDKELCARLGDQARADIARRQRDAQEAGFAEPLAELLEAADARGRSRNALRLQVAEMLDPVLFRLNLRARLDTLLKRERPTRLASAR